MCISEIISHRQKKPRFIQVRFPKELIIYSGLHRLGVIEHHYWCVFVPAAL